MLLAITCEHEAVNDVISHMLLRFSSLSFFVINKASFSKYDKFMFNCALLQTLNRKCLVIKLYKFSYLFGVGVKTLICSANRFYT